MVKIKVNLSGTPSSPYPHLQLLVNSFLVFSSCFWAEETLCFLEFLFVTIRNKVVLFCLSEKQELTKVILCLHLGAKPGAKPSIDRWRVKSFFCWKFSIHFCHRLFNLDRFCKFFDIVRGDEKHTIWPITRANLLSTMGNQSYLTMLMVMRRSKWG